MDRASYLTNQGLTVRLDNGNMIVKPKHLITDEVRLYVKAFRHELINELSYQRPKLSAQQQLWLARIANYLHINNDFLLEHKFIDQYDLDEHINNDPKLIADCIKSSPKWISIEKPVYSVEWAKPEIDAPVVYQVDILDPAHEAFINHLMDNKGSCCYAPANRFCDVGLKLKAAYEMGATL